MFLTHFDIDEGVVLGEEDATHFLADMEGREAGLEDSSGDHLRKERHYHRDQFEAHEEAPPLEGMEIDECVQSLWDLRYFQANLT
jgi:hypothetical protein